MTDLTSLKNKCDEVLDTNVNELSAEEHVSLNFLAYKLLKEVENELDTADESEMEDLLKLRAELKEMLRG